MTKARKSIVCKKREDELLPRRAMLDQSDTRRMQVHLSGVLCDISGAPAFVIRVHQGERTISVRPVSSKALLKMESEIMLGFGCVKPGGKKAFTSPEAESLVAMVAGRL